MSRASFDDLRVLVVVARERSFTRAAARLRVPQSSVSRAIRILEERLDVRLLARTTRSVSLTEAGERLLQGIGPALETIETELSEFGATADQPTGTVRVTTVRHAYETTLRPVLTSFLAEHPAITVEVVIDDALTDIVEKRFDAGIRFGGLVDKDMIAVRVGPDVKVAVVATPGYVAERGRPDAPSELLAHRCINYRMAKAGGLYRWAFEKGGKAMEVSVDGNTVFNDGDAIIEAALDGLGIGYTFYDRVEGHIAEGRLISLLPDWCPLFPGYHLYYSSRRHISPALKALSTRLRNNWRTSPAFGKR